MTNLSIKRCVYLIILVFFNFVNEAQSQGQQKRCLEEEKNIPIDVIDSFHKIKGITFFQNKIYLLTFFNNSHQIVKIGKNGKLISRFTGGFIDSLSSPNTFFRSKNEFKILNYDPGSISYYLISMDTLLNKTQNDLILTGGNTFIKKSPLDDQISYYEIIPSEKERTAKYVVRSWEGKNELLVIDKHIKPSPRRGIKFFFEPTPKSIVACFDDTYELYIGKNGQLRTFTHPTFHNYPYTEKELLNLSPVFATLARQYEPFPPVIENILYINDQSLLVIRKQRPAQTFLLIDKFDVEGNFYCTFTLALGDKKVIQACRLDNKFGILLENNKGFELSVLRQ